MMSFECGLRRKQRELGVAIQQRDRIIREQALVIRFLAEKTGNKTRKISDLKNEAMAKIPQIVTKDNDDIKKKSNHNPKHLTTIRVTGGGGGGGGGPTSSSFPNSLGTELTSILETGSENDGDSDSAIILDDSLASTLSSSSSSNGTSSDHLSPSSLSSSESRRCHLRRISRSVSDVMSVSLMSEGSGPNSSSGNNLDDDDDDDDDDDEGDLEEENHSADKSSAGSLSDPEDLQNPCSFDRESAHYRGFLLRHGSYERYKVRSLRLKKTTTFKELTAGGGRNNSNSNNHLVINNKLAAKKKPRKVTNERTGIHLHHTNDTSLSGSLGSLSNSSSVSSPTSSTSSRPQPSINHRSVTKPRDVKNRHLNKAAKTAAAAASTPTSNEEATLEDLDGPDDDNAGSKTTDFVIAEKHGSVYHSSVFLENDSQMDEHSFA